LSILAASLTLSALAASAAHANIVGEAILETGDTFIPASPSDPVAANQATPYSEISINQVGGVGVQVTVIDETFFTFQSREVLWGDTTTDNGSFIGDAPGGVATIPARIGFGNDGSVVFKQSDGDPTIPVDTVARVSSTGVLTPLVVEGTTAIPSLGTTVGPISFASQTPEGTPYYVANYTPPAGVPSTGLFAGAVPSPVLSTGDAVGNTALVVAASGDSFFAIRDSVDYKQNGTYIAHVTLADSTDLATQLSDALVVNGSVVTVDGQAVITGNTFTGSRTDLTVQISSNPDTFAQIDEAWDAIGDIAINDSGQYIAVVRSNARSDNGDEYLIVNDAFNTAVVDSRLLTGIGSTASFDAVAINNDGDIAYIYDEDLYINDILVLDTDRTVEMTDFLIDDGQGGSYALSSLVGNIQLTDRDEFDVVTAYLGGREFGTGPAALAAEEQLIALDFVVPEPASLALLAIAGGVGLARRRSGGPAA
jgi:hypothetical protein